MSDTPIFCNQCGQQCNPGATFCTRCGGSLVPTGSPAMSQMQRPGMAYSGTRYGGFWIRFVAAIIDGVIVALVLLPVRLVVGAAFGLSHGLDGGGPFRNPAAMGIFVSMMSGMMLLNIVIDWIYCAYLESSERQATLGKMVVGLKVTDLNGNRISFAQATGRHFAKCSNLLRLLREFVVLNSAYRLFDEFL